MAGRWRFQENIVNFHFDISRNLLIYPPVPPHVAASIPESKSFSKYFVVPNSLHSKQVLRHFNYPVPPVITDANYDWPIEPGRKPLDHQKVMANFDVLHPRSFNLSDPGCVDADTEYLSPTGWRKISAYKKGKVAQYHCEGFISFVRPAEYVVRPCHEMYRIKTTRGVDQKLSAEHRVYFIDMAGKAQIATAQAVALAHATQELGWRGRFVTTFEGGAVGVELTENDLRLMVAVVADGHFAKGTSTRRCVISVKKARKKERLRSLLNAAGCAFQEKELSWKTKKGYTRFTFNAPRRDKHFSSFYWRCNYPQLRTIANECIHWDGSAPQGNRGPTFFSTVKESADFVQYAFAATGYTASINEATWNKWCKGWQVTTRNRAALLGIKEYKTKNNIIVEPTTDGKKYCFEVPTNLLLLRRNGCIFVTGNTMKTQAKLWAADWLMRQYPPGKCRCLIVAPLTILETVWVSGIFKSFLGRRSTEILHGSAQKRQALFAKKPDFAIINFDGVKVGAHTRKRLELDGLSADLANDTELQIVIVDEADNYCDAQTGRNRIARLVFGRRPYLWLQTGTPTGNAPTDAYGMAKIVNNAFGKSFTSFRQETMFQPVPGGFKWLPKKEGYDLARKLLTPAIRFSIEEIWKDAPNGQAKMPPLEPRMVALTPAQTKALAALKSSLQIKMASGATIEAINEGAARQKFLQIVQGQVYDSDHDAHEVDAGPRYAEIEYLVRRASRKVVIFASLTSVVNFLYKNLSKYWKCGIINGDVDQKDRPTIIRAFESDSDFKVVIADPQATAHGINEFVVADTVIWAGPTEKTRLYIQGNARVHRPGQKYPVTGYQIVATKLEQEIYRRLETNTSLQGALLQLVQKGEL